MTLEQRIEAAQNSLAAATTDEQKQLLSLGIEKLKEMLSQQKKSESQPSQSTGQLQRTPIRDAAAKVPQEIKDEIETWAEQVEKAQKAKQEFESTMQKSGLMGNGKPSEIFQKSLEQYEQRVIGTIEDPTPAPIPVVAIGFKTKEGKTEIRRLTQTDILTLLKTYFKRVATSAKMESKRYSEAYDSDMGKTVYKLFLGWNMIYNETQEGTAWPPLTDVFPGLSRASQQQKVNAEILWRWASNDK